MKVLVILNQERNGPLRVVVGLKRSELRRRVSTLVDSDRSRQAMDLVVREGIVERYLPPGTKLRTTPDLTFIEDLL